MTEIIYDFGEYMKRIWKIAALALSISVVCAGLMSCRNENKMTEELSAVKSGIEKTRALGSGEVMVYATFKPEKEVEGTLLTSVTESYAKFLNSGTLEYDFTETTKFTSGDDMKSYEATVENGTTIVSRDGVVVDPSEAPDIFSAFNIDYEVADIDKIEVIDAGEQTLYTVTMKDSYAAKADHSENGVDYKGRKVRFNYYLDLAGTARKVVSEYTYEVTVGGGTQNVVVFSQTTVNS